MSDQMTSTTRLAYGVDPTRPERYSLRQSRYQAVGEVVGELIPEFQTAGRSLQLLDVGVWNGISRRYIEPHDPASTVVYHGVDLKLHRGIYKREEWASLQEGDLLTGLPHIPSNTYDVVICEQVLEHLPTVDVALAALSRVAKPGGLLILGVPTFPPGVDLLRRHLVPMWDRAIGRTKARGHLQAFSRTSFVRTIEQHCEVDVLAARGFRIVSGGLLRPLENLKGWWQLNRWLGRYAASLCTEIQVLARKREVATSTATMRRAA